MQDHLPSIGFARFLRLAGRLKRTPRTGWLHRGVPPAEVESVADHSYRTALLAWLAAAEDPTLDRDKVLKLALIHDLAEALAGDLTPYDADALATADDPAAFLNRRHLPDADRKTAKHAAERSAIETMLAELPTARAAEIRALWEEYEARSTPEARFVKQADILETYLQSRDYLAEGADRPMASFAAEAQELVIHPDLRSLIDKS